MPRPLMLHGVGQLEEMFANSNTDAGVLKQLELELQYRQVPRAVALLAEVQAAMYGTRDAAAPAPATPHTPHVSPPRQPDLWTHPYTRSTSAGLPDAPAPVSAPASTSAAAAPLPQRAASTTTVEDACKMLKTLPGATWESIEHTRRLLVQQSSPLRTSKMSADKRAQALAEARRVNEAYATLSTRRTGGR